MNNQMIEKRYYAVVKGKVASGVVDAKIGKSGIGEIKTLHSNEPTTLDFKEFNYDNCYLIGFISLLQ